MRLISFVKSFVVFLSFACTVFAYADYNKEKNELYIEDILYYEGTKDGGKYALSKYKDKGITSLTYVLSVILEVHNSHDELIDGVDSRDFPDEMLQYKKLENLVLTYEKKFQDHSWHKTYLNGKIKKGFLKNFKNLKELTINHIDISQDNIDEIASLSKLKKLTFYECKFVNLNFEALKSHKTLTTLIFRYRYGRYSYGSDLQKNILKNLKSIKHLEIIGYEMTQSNIDEIGTLTNLEYLKYHINSKLNLEPQKKLEKLSTLGISYYEHWMDGDLDEESSVKIKRLNLPRNLKTLMIEDIDLSDDNYREIVSLSNLEKLYDGITEGHNSKINIKDLKKKYTSGGPVSTDGRCGTDYGNTVCPSGQCCSKYNYCGTSDKHCKSGCQSEFGKCKESTTTKPSSTKQSYPTATDGKCGKDNGNAVCSNGNCCSRYGYCGKTDDYCKSGCQAEFGKCK